MSNIEKQSFSLSLASPDDTIHLAQDVAKFIKEQRLFTNIQGKAYVNVEGWQYAGGRLGIVPIMEDVKKLPTDDKSESKYEARVRLVSLKDGQTVGFGFALCSNKETGKRAFQEYAVASMAQTRAISKAYRNLLAWIIRAAGYEPTPYEEMEAVEAEVVESKKPTPKQEPKPEPQQEAPTPGPIEPATVKQKTELLMLLNNKAVTGEEKNKAFETINNLDTLKIERTIAAMKKLIKDRQKGKGVSNA